MSRLNKCKRALNSFANKSKLAEDIKQWMVSPRLTTATQ